MLDNLYKLLGLRLNFLLHLMGLAGLFVRFLVDFDFHLPNANGYSYNSNSNLSLHYYSAKASKFAQIIHFYFYY